MFTGLIEEIGVLEQNRNHVASAVLRIRAKTILKGLQIGDSIAVNGICLTVTSFDQSGFTADVMHETINRSSLKFLTRGSRVNLERAMPANGRFGGHIVSGHVDGIGIIQSIQRDDNAIWYRIQADQKLLRYIVEKGSITIDGISLTVAGLQADAFSVSVIPHTAAVTTLSDRKVGDSVNLETDLIGKYVERLLSLSAPPKTVSAVSSSALPRSSPAVYPGASPSDAFPDIHSGSLSLGASSCPRGASSGKRHTQRNGRITAELLKQYGFC